MPINKSISSVGRGNIIMKTMQVSRNASIRSVRFETIRKKLVSTVVLPL